jgi:hypothetical protein
MGSQSNDPRYVNVACSCVRPHWHVAPIRGVWCDGEQFTAIPPHPLGDGAPGRPGGAQGLRAHAWGGGSARRQRQPPPVAIARVRAARGVLGARRNCPLQPQDTRARPRECSAPEAAAPLAIAPRRRTKAALCDCARVRGRGVLGARGSRPLLPTRVHAKIGGVCRAAPQLPRRRSGTHPKQTPRPGGTKLHILIITLPCPRPWPYPSGRGISGA